jgi:hypothetical protein
VVLFIERGFVWEGVVLFALQYVPTLQGCGYFCRKWCHTNKMAKQHTTH